MALFKYYKLKDKLPKPDGPLSKLLPSSSILAANEEVSKERKDGVNDTGKSEARSEGKEDRIASCQHKFELK